MVFNSAFKGLILRQKEGTGVFDYRK